MRFDRVTTADGLSNDSVFSILQDRHGFLWFGTQAGLNRYDGYRVTQYRYDPRNSNSLGGDFVHSLLEDGRGAIWIGGAVTRLDTRTQRFARFGNTRFSNTAVPQAIGQDTSGFVWVGLSGGRNYTASIHKNGNLTPFEIGGTLPVSDFGVRVIHRDRSGTLWLGATTGLIRFNASTGEHKHHTLARANKLPADIRGITEDGEGKLWLATTPDAPNFFDPHTERFARRWPETNRAGINEPASAILAGPDGVIWRATSSGLEMLHPASGTLAVLRHNAADRYSLSGSEILSLAADRDGGIWVGTKEGVNRFLPSGLKFGAWRRNPADPRSLSDENIRAIYRDRSGVLWLGAYNGGLNRYDAASGTFTHLRHDARDPRSLDNDRVYSIYEDRSGTLWVGTAVGINRLDRKTGTFTHFKRGPIDAGGSPIPTYWMFEDRQRAFWFGAGTVRRLSTGEPVS